MNLFSKIVCGLFVLLFQGFGNPVLAEKCLNENDLTEFFETKNKGNWNEALAQIVQASQSASQSCVKDADYIQGYLNYGRLMWLRGDLPYGEKALQKVLSWALENKDKDLEVEALVELAEVGFLKAHLMGTLTSKESENLYVFALEKAKEYGRNNLVSASLGRIGVIYERRGNYVEAEKYYQEALRIAEEIGEASLFHLPLTHLAGLAENKKDYETAIPLLERAHEITLNSPSVEQRVFGIINLTNARLANGDISLLKALEQTHEAQNLAVKLKHQIGQCMALLTLARFYSMSGEKELSLEYANRALSVSQKNEYSAYVGFAKSVLDLLNGA